MFSLLHWNLEHDLIKVNKVVNGVEIRCVYIYNLYMHLYLNNATDTNYSTNILQTADVASSISAF